MGQRVKRIKTEVSEPQMAQAFINAWGQLFNTTPSKKQIALVMAQNNLETGHRKEMYNFNVGNLTTDGKGRFNYYDDITTDEQVQPGKWEKKNLKYRAYRSLDEGAKDYLSLLSSEHYADVWQHIINPNPTAFSKSLKNIGYYTANEEPYTKDIVSLYNKFDKSNVYEQARSGNVPPVKNTPGQLASNESILQKFLHGLKDKGVNMFGKKPQGTPVASPGTEINTLLNSYLQSVLASEKENKKLYNKYLPQNKAIIRINYEDYTSSVEFGRVLCLALNEELLAKSFVHTNENNVEVSVSIPGPQEISFEAIKEVTSGVTEAFKQATKKIGSIGIKTELITNKTSSYHPINLKVAEIQHRKFLLKFV